MRKDTRQKVSNMVLASVVMGTYYWAEVPANTLVFVACLVAIYSSYETSDLRKEIRELKEATKREDYDDQE